MPSERKAGLQNAPFDRTEEDHTNSLTNLLGLVAQGDNPIGLHVRGLAGGSRSPRWGQS